MSKLSNVPTLVLEGAAELWTLMKGANRIISTKICGLSSVSTEGVKCRLVPMQLECRSRGPNVRDLLAGANFDQKDTLGSTRIRFGCYLAAHATVWYSRDSDGKNLFSAG